MDHSERLGGFSGDHHDPSLRRSLECTSESYLAVIAITTCRERTSLASSSFYAARARLRELFAVKLRCSPCRRLVSNEDFSYVDFGSSLRGEVMSRRFNSPFRMIRVFFLRCSLSLFLPLTHVLL